MNETADTLAKEAAGKARSERNRLRNWKDGKKIAENKIIEKWEHDLEKEENHVFKLMGKTNNTPNLKHLTRKESIVITRLRIGHTNVTHSHLLEKKPPPICECKSHLTVKHMFECQKHRDLREKFKIKDHNVLDSENAEVTKRTIEYLKATNLFWKI